MALKGNSDIHSRESAIVLIFVASVMVIGGMYGVLPEKMPLHYNAAGEMGNSQNKEIGLVVLLFFTAVFYLLTRLARKKQGGRHSLKMNFYLRMWIGIIWLSLAILFSVSPVFHAIQKAAVFVVFLTIFSFLLFIIKNRSYFRNT